MAKLFFYYSVMNAGKTTHLLNARHNYLENDNRVLLFTSALDDRHGVGKITARTGFEAEAYALRSDENALDIVCKEHQKSPLTAVLVDEVQFLTPDHVSQFSDVVDYLDIPVMAYGLKNNAYGELFSPAVHKLLALADEINLIKTVCHCGRRATMILKYNPDGSIVRSGEVVETGGESRYVSVCRKHWKSGDIGRRAFNSLIGNGTVKSVQCNSCGNHHKMIGDHDQGDDCAAQVSGNTVSGYYGSSIADGTTYRFVSNIPDDVKQGIICDKCIQRLVDRRDLVEISRSF
jgi:thymidine kinase